MPTYTYMREDGTRFEATQRITDEPLRVCPDTGQAVRRVIVHAANVDLSRGGSGFYENDYRRKET